MTDEEIPEGPSGEDEEDVYIIDDSKEESYDDLLKEIESTTVDDEGEATGLELAEEQHAESDTGDLSVHAENAELKDRWLRTRADFENYKRRSEREKREQYDTAVSNTIRQLLPVVDNFERALDSARSHSTDQSVIEGIEMISVQLVEVLRNMGVEIIDQTGIEFDPNFHEAVQTVENSEVPPHSVVQVMQKGYRKGERLIRPAMVVVSASVQGGPETEESDTESDE